MPEPDDGKATLDSGQLASRRVSGRETPKDPFLSYDLPPCPLSSPSSPPSPPPVRRLRRRAATNWPNFARPRQRARLSRRVAEPSVVRPEVHRLIRSWKDTPSRSHAALPRIQIDSS